MCGICGIYHAQSEKAVLRSLIEQMTGLIAHRGPDDIGCYIDGLLGLGFARLSIIDLSGGHQPMCNGTGEVWLVCNGEIWNYRALRQELSAKGHRFHTHCDTETIIHAYEEYGPDCLTRLHGMFALAIWDRTHKRLLLARDRVGKKPLYYTQINGDLLFASEIKALLCHPEVKREADMQALSDFLSIRYVPAPATLFANIYKVLPGHWLLYENGTIYQDRYWDYTFGEVAQRPLEQYLSGIKEHIYRAVEERMMADVPVGALLSGGVDSSIITGIMSKLTDHQVKTFSVGFDHPAYNELPYARLVADHFGTKHHELIVNAADLTRYWPLLTWHRDEPVSEPSDLGVYLISQLARQHVKVVLSGEGGDELFAGYPKYVVDWLADYYRLFPEPLRDQLITPAFECLPYRMRKLKMAARNLSQPAPQRWMSWFGIFNDELKERLLSEQIQASVDGDASRAFRHQLERNPQRDQLSSMLYLDTKIWLPDNLLMKADKMTMAASLETRIPLLDYRLIEYAASIPSQTKIKTWQAKYLLKRAFADFLPTPILTRKKMGFNVPTGIWFREQQGDLITRLLLSERMRSRGYFNAQFVAEMVRAHVEGRINYQAQLFTLASLELWFRVFIDPPQLAIPNSSVEEMLREEGPGIVGKREAPASPPPFPLPLPKKDDEWWVGARGGGADRWGPRACPPLQSDTVAYNRLRVLMVTGIYPTEQRPHAGTFIKSQVDSLIEAGLTVEVLHPRPGPPLFRYISAAIQVFGKTLTGRYDLVHGHYGLWCLVARLQWKAPVVASFLGDDILGTITASGRYSRKGQIVAAISRKLCSLMDAVIVKSAQMQAKMRGPQHKIFVIPNGVNFELFRPFAREAARSMLGWDQQRYYVLFGNNPRIPVKNFALAQAAIACSRSKGFDVELVVASGLPQTTVAQYMNASNALILTSLAEGSPNVVKEAMACNIPVIATNVGDVAAVIGRTKGCSVCTHDAEALADGLAKALQQSEPTTGRQDIAHLDVTAIAQQLIALYTHVIQSKAQGGKTRLPAAAPQHRGERGHPPEKEAAYAKR